MTEPLVSDTFGRFFNPESWSAARRFQVFVGPPWLHGEVAKGARVTVNHLEKFQTLAALASRLAHGLIEDQNDLDRNG